MEEEINYEEKTIGPYPPAEEWREQEPIQVDQPYPEAKSERSMEPISTSFDIV